MGKGYNNYMCKKPFHPGSKANIKRAWMAEQKTENEKRKQDDLRVQYEKEQDLYNNKALISSESKDKLELNFMYEAPPGAKRERQKEDDEPEYKFEWQRKYNAPREDYAKGNADIKDQPFGIPVRNVRCIKCHKWGHINTDKECPLYSQASASSMPTTSMDPLELMKQMKEDGYGLKENVLGHHINPLAANQQFIPSDESDPETEFLKSLSTADKKKLLRKLKKLSKKQEKASKNKKKKRSKKSHKLKRKESSSSDSEDDKRKKKKSRKDSSSSSSDSRDESDDERHRKKKRNKKSSKEKNQKTRLDLVEQSSAEESGHKSRDTSKHVKSVKRHESTKSSHSEEKKRTTKDTHRADLKDVKIEEECGNPEGRYCHKSHQRARHLSSSDKEGLDPCSKFKTSTSKRARDDLSDVATKKIKVEPVEPHRISSTSTVSDPDFKHPDGFSHMRPQARIEANYSLAEKEYVGNLHDKFRYLNRDNRSPSVKQKYNK